MKRSIFIILSAFGIMTLLATPMAFGATSFPQKEITLEVGFPAGGGADMVARSLAAGAEKILGEKILVVNKPGAGGAVAAALLSRSRPDGYTILLTTDTPFARAPHMRRLSYDPMKAFTFIERVGVFKCGFAVLENSPFKSWKGLVKWAKKHPDQLKYGSPPPGTTPDLAMTLIAKKEGFTYRSSPFKGEAPLFTALLGGHLDVAGGTAAAWSNYVRAKKMRVLLLFEQNKAYPNIPTFKDEGYNLELPLGIFIYGPAGIPANIVDKLSQAFAQAARSKTFQNVAKTIGLADIDQPLAGAALDKYVIRNYELYKEYFSEAGLLKKKNK